MPFYGYIFNVKVIACEKTLHRHICYICKDVPSVLLSNNGTEMKAVFRPWWTRQQLWWCCYFGSSARL